MLLGELVNWLLFLWKLDLIIELNMRLTVGHREFSEDISQRRASSRAVAASVDASRYFTITGA